MHAGGGPSGEKRGQMLSEHLLDMNFDEKTCHTDVPGFREDSREFLNSMHCEPAYRQEQRLHQDSPYQRATEPKDS
jgi:hypothetical protein